MATNITGEKQLETVKVTMTFTNSAAQPINMSTTPTLKFYKQLKRETILDPNDVNGLYLRTTNGSQVGQIDNPSTGVYEFLINLPALEDDQSREVLEITATGVDTATVQTSNTLEINILR